MQIEVPSDKYDAAVEAMQEKIKNGRGKKYCEKRTLYI